MASKGATAKAPEKTAAPPKEDTRLVTLKAELAGVKEAVRRLASGAVVTEEQRNELFDLLEGK